MSMGAAIYLPIEGQIFFLFMRQSFLKPGVFTNHIGEHGEGLFFFPFLFFSII